MLIILCPTILALILGIPAAYSLARFELIGGVMSAAALITVIPMIIFGLLVQNNLVRGLTAGSGK